VSNVSGLIPSSAFAALHNSRLEAATVNEVRDEVAALATEAERLRRENTLLVQRLDLAEQARGDATRRIGALEATLPDLVTAIPERATIDPSTTAALSGGKVVSFEAEGGSVRVEQKPLLSLQPGKPYDAPVAAILAPEGSFGVALGFPVSATDTEEQWQGLLAKVGTLLIGLWPVVTDAEAGGGRLVVAGPLETETQAAELCDRLDRVGIPCEPVPFKGEPLPMLN